MKRRRVGRKGILGITAILVILMAILMISITSSRSIVGTAWESVDQYEEIEFYRDGIYEWRDTLTGDYAQYNYVIDKWNRFVEVYDAYGTVDEFTYTIRGKYMNINLYGEILQYRRIY